MKISVRTVLLLTSVYIILPIILFFFWWTHFLVGVVTALFSGAVIWTQTNKVRHETFFIPKKTFLITLLLVLVWTVLSGAGHRGVFDGDYYKHNAIFHDLISFTWPVRYRLFETGDILQLVYYFAYYLPSALIGKLWGWQAGNGALFIWTFAGVFLSFIWFYSFITEKKQLLYGLLFPLFSGLDGVGKLIMRAKVVNNEWEWWGRNWQYSGNTTLFFYVPQHAIIGWLLMGILLYGFIKNKKLPLQWLLLSASLLWSPFVFLGILPFYLLLFFREHYFLSKKEILLALFIFGTTFLFLSSNMTFSAKETAASGWLWQTERLLRSWVLVRLGLFYLLEFALFSFFIFHALFKNMRRTQFIAFSMAFFVLLILPWYKLGLMNDLAMRASIPALYVISYFWIRSVVDAQKSRLLHFVTITLFIIGSLYPLMLSYNALIHFSVSSPEYSLAHLETPKVRKQYLGLPNSTLFRVFNSDDKRGIMGELSLIK